jgi:hypothetical protein
MTIGSALHSGIEQAISNGIEIGDYIVLPDLFDAEWEYAWFGEETHLIGIAGGDLHRPSAHRQFIQTRMMGAFAVTTFDYHMIRSLAEQKIDEINLPEDISVDKESITVNSVGVFWTLDIELSRSKTFDIKIGTITVRVDFEAKVDMKGTFIINEATKLFLEYEKIRHHSVDWSTKPVDISGLPGVGDFIDAIVTIGLSLATADLNGSRLITEFNDVDKVEYELTRHTLLTRFFKS